MSSQSVRFDHGPLMRALDYANLVVRRLDGVITHWTQGCEQIYGWPADQAVGQHICSLLQTSPPGCLGSIDQSLKAQGHWTGELEHHRRDGRSVIISLSCSLLTGSAVEAPSVLEIHTDITQRLREVEAANHRLATMATELERSNEELEQFARIASHDLSAPITSTCWLVDLLAARHSGQLDDHGREIVKQISQGLERMSELVEAVLMHARVGTSAISSAEAFPSEAAVILALENLRKHVETTDAEVDFGELPGVNIDKSPLCQLFQNLLSNAIKYRRPDTTPKIQIAAHWQNPLWEFSVADNGIGIEPEWHQRIFQPLQRRHGVEVAGSGIGLATCKKIVTRAGGEIWVESVVGEGSVFHFTLPGPGPKAP